jgi:hypothetical protein
VGRRVVAPDGGTWTVRRRWAPRLGRGTLLGRFRRGIGKLRAGRKLRENADILDLGCLFDELFWVVGAVLVVTVLVAIVLVVFVVPLVLAVIDVVVVLAIAGAGLVGRLLFGRPWTVEARSPSGDVRSWPVVGWRTSRERCAEIAELLAAGVTPPAEVAPGGVSPGGVSPGGGPSDGASPGGVSSGGVPGGVARRGDDRSGTSPG